MRDGELTFPVGEDGIDIDAVQARSVGDVRPVDVRMECGAVKSSTSRVSKISMEVLSGFGGGPNARAFVTAGEVRGKHLRHVV
ncbi:hypothetical protein AB0G35_34975 [Streptomyces sp. NPDC021749]|uniref:hypothetical protein n=1 Tax=Streptomyces sp. NPDC021749 TaxID=3154905 RepID=UPI0033FA339C